MGIEQHATWKHIQNIYLNKFPIVWVKFGQGERLNKWAQENSKDVWYYTEEEDVTKLIYQIKTIR